jgi:2-dehydropantoate 2-reductase
MKVGVVGCGAVGSFYGAKLARAGAEVHFLLRSDYETVRREGVFIRSVQGDFRVHPHAARSPHEIGPCDLVLVALKATANDQFARLLPPLVGPATAVLTLQNGLGNEELLGRLFAPGQILGGLCFVCLNRLQPGLIHHIDHGQIVVGEFQRAPGPRTHQVAERFRQAGVPCAIADNLQQAHWEKLTWNIPFNGLGVAGVAGLQAVLSGELPPGARLGECLTTDKLLSDANWLRLVQELILEVIAAGRALGLNLSAALAERLVERTRTMGAYRASTLLDFQRGLPLELESLFLEPLRQARQAGVPVPRLEALCRVLRQLDSAGTQT